MKDQTIEERAKELYPDPEPLESGKYESREDFKIALWLVDCERRAYKAGSKEGIEEFKKRLVEEFHQRSIYEINEMQNIIDIINEFEKP